MWGGNCDKHPTCLSYKITNKNDVDTDEEAESLKTKVYTF